MKLKDFLEQLKDLDPETEVYKWVGRHRYSIEELDSNTDKVKVGYTIDNNSPNKGYSEFSDSPYDKKVIIIP